MLLHVFANNLKTDLITSIVFEEVLTSSSFFSYIQKSLFFSFFVLFMEMGQNVNTDDLVTRSSSGTSAPTHSVTTLNHAELPEKFNGLNFKRWHRWSFI